jgi:hypothetical protein
MLMYLVDVVILIKKLVTYPRRQVINLSQRHL